jgi:hypothetical protein
LLDHAYLAFLVREDLVVAGSDRVEASRLCLLAIGPAVARGRLGHLGILPQLIAARKGEVREAVGLRQMPFAGMPVSGYLAMINVAFYRRATVSG